MMLALAFAAVGVAGLLAALLIPFFRWVGRQQHDRKAARLELASIAGLAEFQQSMEERSTEVVAQRPVDQPRAGNHHPWLKPINAHDASLSPENLRRRYEVLMASVPEQQHIP